MNDLIQKISSYNIFTNLFPGVLFCLFADHFYKYSLIQENLFVGIFLYYFIGLIISRIGSLIVEPLLMYFNLLRYSNYSDYVRALKNDDNISTLLETNNMYRSLTSLFICTFSLSIFNYVTKSCNLINEWKIPILLLLLLVLFIFSYVKQTNYIRNRINTVNSNQKDQGDGSES